MVFVGLGFGPTPRIASRTNTREVLLLVDVDQLD
jgi:hypothetical protein